MGFYTDDPLDDVVCALAEQMMIDTIDSRELTGYGKRYFWSGVCKILNEGKPWHEKLWTEEKLLKLVSRRRTKLFKKLEPLLKKEEPDLWTGKPEYFLY